MSAGTEPGNTERIVGRGANDDDEDDEDDDEKDDDEEDDEEDARIRMRVLVRLSVPFFFLSSSSLSLFSLSLPSIT